ADFGGLPAVPERISRAVERGSPVKMRASEKKQDQRSLPVQSGKSGGWRSDLPQPQVARIEAAWGDIMTCLGYELVTLDSRSALQSSLIGLLAAGAVGRSGARPDEVPAGKTSVAPGSLSNQLRFKD